MEIVNNILKTIIRCLTIVILVSIIFTFFTFSISEDGFKIDNKFPDNYSIRIDGGQLRINGINPPHYIEIGGGINTYEQN
tara:strand:+ start:7058 stop:7297 length:240 start_codon:yes stop_codon:yes gene_type:complete